ncbi:GntR family transcriptional regulator [Rhodoferax sp. U11-2br]|uniref:GntR family transcriptional regulator n=1 Tax=Rhodoferax sp. U11-2br TaxID=2838878 RepID=UPI001BEAABE2|nr:GntR family transcriptional regulator [Rhodoferax sp. U11-2br]MBT3066421.1 GntR family transcriptional regulator [Rhodoferax sp. U11-2br]
MRSKTKSVRAFQHVEPVSIGTQLHRHLRGAIIRGELRPGQALSESEIAKRYETSRQPVREAFIKLAEERLVVILPQRGTFVIKISVADVLDARFVRQAIEMAVVQDAAISAPPSAVKDLRDLIEQQKAVVHGHNEDFLALDEEFHRTIALSVSRAHAWRVIEGIKAQMDRIRYLSLDDATPLSVLIEQHSRIVDGIEAHDPVAAATALRAHLQEIIVSLPNIAAQFPDLFESA